MIECMGFMFFYLYVFRRCIINYLFYNKKFDNYILFI